MSNNKEHSLGHAVGTALTWTAIIYLVCKFIGWLMARKSTAWIGVALLLFVPVTLAVVIGLGCFLTAIECYPRGAALDNFTVLEAEISLAISVGVGIAVSLLACCGEKIQNEAKKKSEVKWYDKEPKSPDDIMFSYWEGRIKLNADGKDVADGRLAMAETYGKILICICRDGHGITKTRDELAGDGVLQMYDEQDCIR